MQVSYIYKQELQTLVTTSTPAINYNARQYNAQGRAIYTAQSYTHVYTPNMLNVQHATRSMLRQIDGILDVATLIKNLPAINHNLQVLQSLYHCEYLGRAYNTMQYISRGIVLNGYNVDNMQRASAEVDAVKRMYSEMFFVKRMLLKKQHNNRLSYAVNELNTQREKVRIGDNEVMGMVYSLSLHMRMFLYTITA